MSMDISDSLPDTGKDIIQIKVIDDAVEILLSNWKVFPGLYSKFLDGEITYTDRYTLGIEKMGERLREKLEKKKEIKDDEIICFFMHVVVWGGNYYVYSNMINRYRKEKHLKEKLNEKEIHEEIAESIRCAMGFLQQGDKCGIQKAIKRITAQKGLDMSYGSKILRMLSPQQVGVYDSVLARNLPFYKEKNKSKFSGYAGFRVDYKGFCTDYKENRSQFIGYVGFCTDCKEVADKLDTYAKKKNGEKWRVADVEAVLFFYYKRAEEMIKRVNEAIEQLKAESNYHNLSEDRPILLHLLHSMFNDDESSKGRNLMKNIVLEYIGQYPGSANHEVAKELKIVSKHTSGGQNDYFSWCILRSLTDENKIEKRDNKKYYPKPQPPKIS